MATGLLVGYFVPSVSDAFQSASIGSVSLPVALGLIVMLLPVFCKVPYEILSHLFATRTFREQTVFSAVLNWVIGPLMMTGLAWAALPDLPDYRDGLILIGLARCIAMVALWNTLAEGSIEYCAILIAMNSIFQLIFYAPLAVLCIGVLSGNSKVGSNKLPTFFWNVTESVLIFLGIPLVIGVAIRYSLRNYMGSPWFDRVFIPRFSPLALVGLLYTVVVLFAVQSRDIINNIGSVLRVAVPLLCYFMLMFTLTLLLAYYFKFSYPYAVTQAFTASSNNFELAIAIAIGTFGVTSPTAVAAVVGPLIEVPVLLSLVYFALWLQPWWSRNLPPASLIQPQSDSCPMHSIRITLV